MKKFRNEQKKLLADFLANIGVAWFAAGVIGLFISGAKNIIDAVLSLVWGFGLSAIFLWFGMIVVKGQKI